MICPGPFHWFFTLSSGDQRCSENFTSVMEENGWVINYEVDKDGREQVTVDVPEGGKTEKKPWKRFLEENVPENQHEMIRKNVLLATRNFQHRVEMFRKKILFGNNNPMKIRHISYRVEFQVNCKISMLLVQCYCSLRIMSLPRPTLVEASMDVLFRF